MEPWDGPASIIFTDGTVVGAAGGTDFVHQGIGSQTMIS